MKWSFRKPVAQKGDGISLLVPYRSDNGRRAETWNWLRRYWANELPGAEIVIGRDNHTPFSKTSAVNDAASRATGDVLVILDADCYLSGDVVVNCASLIRSEGIRSHPLWFMPYRSFYRLTDSASRAILATDPKQPTRYFAMQPSRTDTLSPIGSVKGHWFGALVQVMPREAFDAVGGMDTRFAGWGGEDVAFMHAVDTLYGKHRTTPNGVIHLWHPSIGDNVKNRMWTGQDEPGTNSKLAERYFVANGDIVAMRKLVSEHREN
jgi:glycosyltransferase involved in cell wall biosynthesis